MRKQYLKKANKNKIDEHSPGYEQFKRKTEMVDVDDI